MKLFHSTYDEYYDAGVGEFPLPIRCVRNVALAIVWAFALCMWRAAWKTTLYARALRWQGHRHYLQPHLYGRGCLHLHLPVAPRPYLPPYFQE